MPRDVFGCSAHTPDLSPAKQLRNCIEHKTRSLISEGVGWELIPGMVVTHTRIRFADASEKEIIEHVRRIFARRTSASKSKKRLLGKKPAVVKINYASRLTPSVGVCPI